ncbi:MAG: hypothetical protein M5U09_21655 [Gammaproteobacteria bacterium]|nr:hypothetical protein [Gammaproteobacteria bacterium]
MDEGFVNRDADIIRMTPFLLVGVFVIRGLAGFVDAYCVQWVGRKVIYDLRREMFGRMIRLRPCATSTITRPRSSCRS